MQPMTTTTTSRFRFQDEKRLMRLRARVSAVMRTEQVFIRMRSAVSTEGDAVQPRECRSCSTEEDSAWFIWQPYVSKK